MVATETLLLAFAIACLTEPGRQDFVMRLFEKNFRYALLLTGYFFVYVGWLLYLIIRTIEIFLPCEDTGSKINIREYKPKELFYLNNFDVCGNLISTFEEHKKAFSQMSKTEIRQEYIYELRKLSCIRESKHDKVKKTLKQLRFVIGAAVLFGILVLVGEIYA